MTTRTSPKSLFRSLVLLLSLASCATPSGVERDAKQTDLDKLRALAGKVDGRVAWTSGRDGIPHIFTMKIDGSDLRQLTTGNHTDWYPRFSPEGGKVLFSRSRAKGFVRQSQSNEPGAWDLYTVNVDGSDLQKVAAGGVWGSWISPNEILFVRGTEVIRAKLDGGEETVMDASDGPFGGASLQQPQLSPDGKYLALTLGGARRQVGIWKVKKKLWNQVGVGGQATWTPDGTALVWIDMAGKDLAEITRVAIEKGVPAKDGDKPQKPTSVLDMTGRRSREAFPRMSNDGKWVIFGSGITGLENDVEDYELFLWEVGSPPETTARLTYYTGNDSWPDIFAGGAPSPKAADQAAESGAPEGGRAEDDTEKTEKAEKAEKAPDEASAAPSQPEAAAEASAPAADEEIAPSKAKGTGKKPSPKAKKKRR